MQNRLLFSALFLLWSIAAIAQKQLANSVYFDTDQSELKPESRQTLERLLGQLARMPDFDITIEAYTDDRGTAEYNKALAERRAGAVQTFLAGQGYQPRRVIVTPVGISKQQGGKSTAENRRLNRRVDVTVTPNLIDDFSELREKTAAPLRNEFTLQPGSEAVFTGNSGIKLQVPANAFVLANGKAPDSPVTIRLQEAARPMDWILQGLSTHTADGRILETGGMYHIEAFAGDHKLQIRKGAALTITLPQTTTPDPEMELFYGVRDATHNAIAWQQASSSEESGTTPDPFSMDPRAIQRYHFFDSMRVKFNAVTLEKIKPPQAPVFYGERLRRATRRAPRPPRMQEPVKPLQPVAQAPFARDAEEAKRLQKKDSEAMSAYRKKMKKYRDKKAIYRERWTKFHKDSTDYAKAVIYREECLGKLRQYENALHEYCLKNQFNNRVASFRRFYWSYSLKEGMSDVSSDAHQHMLYYPFLRTRNKLRRQLRQPVLSSHCRYYVEGDSLRCGDPDTQAWLQKGKALLAGYRESSGYNQVMAEINTAYEQFLDDMRQKATENVQNLATYTFEVSSMGWINIDKFYQYPETDRTPVIVAEVDKDTRVYLVFRDFNSALALPYRNGRFESQPLPKGIPLTVVALKLQAGSPQLMMFDTKVGDNSLSPKLPYETLTLKQLQEKMDALNS